MPDPKAPFPCLCGGTTYKTSFDWSRHFEKHKRLKADELILECKSCGLVLPIIVKSEAIIKMTLHLDTPDKG